MISDILNISYKCITRGYLNKLNISNYYDNTIKNIFFNIWNFIDIEIIKSENLMSHLLMI